jgi:hypothetical protein
MKIDEAPLVLDKKYYSRHRCKEVNEYEWTILRKYALAEIQRLDREFKKPLRNTKTRIKASK